MPPVAAAVLPHPPLLVAELAGAAAAELDPLRAACRRALTAVTEAADLTIVVGDGPVWGVPEPSAPGSFRPFGADVDLTLPALVPLDLPGLPPPARLTELPLSLAVAAHLLAAPAHLLAAPAPPPIRRSAATVPASLAPPPTRLFAATVPASLGPGAAAAIGRTLTTAARGSPGERVRGGGVGLVAMGDLSACRTERAPGAFRPEAAGFDASVAEAFRTAKPERLLDLDPAQAADLLVAGRVPLQVLAGAFEDTPAVHGQGGGEAGPAGGGRIADEVPPTLRGEVLYEDAPYGVGYLVALLAAP